VQGRRNVRVKQTVARLALVGLAWFLVPLGLDQVVKLSGFLYSLAAVAAGVAAYLLPRLWPTRRPRASDRSPQPKRQERRTRSGPSRRKLIVAVGASMGMGIAVVFLKDFLSEQEDVPPFIYATPPPLPTSTPVPTTSPPPM
jgi:uncharacterized membrane protein YbhN (UPF0104 family)